MEKLARVVNRKIDGQTIYLTCFCIILFIEFLLTSTFDIYVSGKYTNWILDILILPLLFKIFVLDKYRWYQLLYIAIALGIAVLSWKHASSNVVFILLTLVLSAKGVNFKKVIYSYFCITCAMMIMVMLYSSLHIIRDLIYYRHSIPRYSFGIVYPTDFAAHIFSLILAYCYLIFDKLDLKRYVIIALIAVGVNYFNNARLSTIMILLIIPIMWIAQKAKNNVRWAQIFAGNYWIFTPILAFLTIYTSYFFTWNNHILIKIDNLLSGRIHLSNFGFYKYGFSLFGQKIIEHGWGSQSGLKLMSRNATNYFYIDSSYVRLAIIYGILVGLIILSILLCVSIRSIYSGRYVLAAIVLLLSISSMIDQHMLEVAYNPFVIALLANVYSNSKQGKSNELI